jgi:hypothetical protein
VKTVYVALLDEGTDCWRPVQAEHMSGDVYRLCGPKHEDEVWEFQPGELVRCKPRRLLAERKKWLLSKKFHFELQRLARNRA